TFPIRKIALLCGLLVGISAPLTTLQAAPMAGPNDISFYSPPVAPGGTRGELIWYRQTSVNLGANAPAIQAWNVLYRSTDARGAPNLVTGTVIVPSARWT